MVGVGYRFKEKVALAGEAGYIFSSNYVMNNDNKGHGFIIRPGLRFYLNKRNNLYFQTQVFYKLVDYLVHDSLYRNINGNRFRAPLDDYIFRKEVWGMNFMIGAVLPIWDEYIFSSRILDMGQDLNTSDG